MTKPRYSSDLLHDILANELDSLENNYGSFIDRHFLFEKLLHNRDLQNIINIFTSHKFRQTSIFYLKFNNSYLVSGGEKMYSLDFLKYILLFNPVIPYDLFPKDDRYEINKFIKNKILTAFYDRIANNKLFDNKDIEETKIINQKIINIRLGRKFGLYNIYGFKTKNFSFSPNVFLNNYGLNGLIKQKELKNKVILDCGACDGDSAYMFNAKFKPKNIICFEPDKKNYRDLIKNLSINHINNVIPFNIGVGSKKTSVRINGTGGEAKISTTGDKTNIDTIDSVCTSNNFSDIGLIKMDVEGYELEALKGAEKTIKKFNPILIICLYHKGRDLFEIPQYIKGVVPKYKLRFLNLERRNATTERVLIAHI